MAEAKMTPMEMFNELARLGYIVPSNVEPSRLREPTAYISVPTMLAAFSPPIQVAPTTTKQGRTSNAELGGSGKRNTKRKR
jgi:hypothetical protein